MTRWRLRSVFAEQNGLAELRRPRVTEVGCLENRYTEPTSRGRGSSFVCTSSDDMWSQPLAGQRLHPGYCLGTWPLEGGRQNYWPVLPLLRCMRSHAAGMR